MSAARRPAQLGPSATLDLSECVVELYDDLHYKCDDGCTEDCVGITMRHKPSGLHTGRIFKKEFGLQLAVIYLARKVEKWHQEMAKVNAKLAAQTAAISEPEVPLELQDMEA